MYLFDNECFYFSGIKIKANKCATNYTQDTCAFCIFYRGFANQACVIRIDWDNTVIDCYYNQNFTDEPI